MLRLKSDIRITVKNNNIGKLHKIELIKLPTTNRRYWRVLMGKIPIYYSKKLYLFGNGIRIPFRWAFCGFLLFGATNQAEMIWSLGDILNGMMAIPNLIAILALGGVVLKLSQKNKID